MKSFAAVIAAFLGNRSSRSNLKTLGRLLALLFILITIYSVLFHIIMEREGSQYSWVTGLYWTLTVMSTLGFGDITFKSDLGMVFSIVVLVSGVMFLLVILPFTFIEFFYEPWMKAQAAARAPKELPESTHGHVIFTCHDPITAALIPMLEKYGHSYVVLTPHITEALEFYEQGVKVAVGELDDPETYRRMRLKKAAVLVATRSDVLNTNITFSAREESEDVPIVASATTEASRDMLELAGATEVMRLEQVMAKALARRVIGNDAAAHVIGQAGGLVIAEASVSGTRLIGGTVASSGIRGDSGLSVVGIWDHGKLRTVDPETVIEEDMVLVLAGTEDQIEAYNAVFRLPNPQHSLVLIVGGGRVGRITSKVLQEAGVKSVIIEKISERVEAFPDAVIGDATQMETLKVAHAREAKTVIITTHDDDLNISLTIFFRRLRESFQIISRCTLERNVRTLHRAGADLVLSSATMGANTIFNLVREDDNLLLAEGVLIFPTPVPAVLAGRRLADCAIRTQTGCTVIAVEHEGKRVVNPDPFIILPHNGILLLIGTLEAEEKFLRDYKPDLAPESMRRKWRRKG
ncbi:NAD-binding protein [Luteolibacter sp. SL250]|uniref:potassium channel family protein n=1 Tax=Luteolibacter sp. SL250 TaxID=2995170 RepID=UPI0022707C8F|nr:NAD-binding protein [Luteolibacter sp. SL250]WAC19575.1 NAD-binding protein [Luteolibacter sp. SL250]